MQHDHFKTLLRSNRGLLGSWSTFASFSSTEVMTTLGFDFIVLDMQHCELTQSSFPALFGAFRHPAPVPVVRVSQNDYHLINWLADQGAPALIVPMVNSVEEAQRAVAGAKFPPTGRRSFGPQRAAGYGADIEGYIARADEALTLIVQIEHVNAVRDIQNILAVPGIDAVFMGPNDLAFSRLQPGESIFSAPGRPDASKEGVSSWTAFARTAEVMALCEEVLRAAQAACLPFGTTAGSIEEARQWLAKGASFATFGNDFLFLRAGAKQLCGALNPQPASGWK